MDQEIKAQWIAALRSGVYLQGYGQLRTGAMYCCLGVLCDLHAKAEGSQWDEGSYDHSSDPLPESVALWALIDTCPTVNEAPLVNLNDGVDGYKHHTFAQIADLIEEYL